MQKQCAECEGRSSEWPIPCEACGGSEDCPSIYTHASTLEARVAALEKASRIPELENALRPWGSGGIITGTVLAWISAHDRNIAKSIVDGMVAVDRALATNPSR